MNRRQFLELSALLLANGVVAPDPASAQDQRQLFILGQAFIQQPVAFFSTVQRQLISLLVDAIIPRTDTPGALDARADHFVELCVASWMTDGERKIFMQGLQALRQQLTDQQGKDFFKRPYELQVALLTEQLDVLEARHRDADWYQFGRRIDNDFDSGAPFICQLKELTAVGFFMSELAATQVQHHNPMPGRFEGDIPLGKEQPCWARNTPGDYA